MKKREDYLPGDAGGLGYESLHFSAENVRVIQSLFESIPIPMVLVGKDERILSLNRAYKSFLRLGEQDYIGCPILELISNSRIPGVMKSKKALWGWHHTFVDGNAAGQEAICHCIPVVENGETVACFGIVLFQTIDEFLSLSTQLDSLKRELHYYKGEIRNMQSTKYSVDSILGCGPAVSALKARICKLAVSHDRSTVLIQGESGAGKELVAQAIHSMSPRGPHPFVRINCAAIPESLCDAEFFGYEDGAFTGARKGGNAGKFELANRGTLFLDEISELPLLMQAKLLRVLQEKEVTRVGGRKTISVDVRVIAATNRDLEAMVLAGTFRRDLYYRLNILNVRVPPLRERMDDLEILIDGFAQTLYKDYGSPKHLTPEVLRILKAYAWPGNVRELSNVVEKMYFASDSDTITVRDIPLSVLHGEGTFAAGRSTASALDEAVLETECGMVKRAMEQCENNVSRVAELLHTNRPRIYRILERIRESEKGENAGKTDRQA